MSADGFIPSPNAGRFVTSRRGAADPGFIADQRSLGRSDHTIAAMLGVALEDVTGVKAATVELVAVERPKIIQPRLRAHEIPEVAAIICNIAEQYGVRPLDILGPSQRPEHVEPRHEAMAVVFELNAYTLRQMAEIFNKTNPAILHGMREHYKRLAADDRSGW